MVKLNFDRILPYDATRLWEMVGDVSKYPDYIPWVSSMRVYNMQTIDPEKDGFDAEIGVGFKFLSERFTTRIVRDRSLRTIDIALLKGPFKKLNCLWKFSDDPKGSRVQFDIEFEFRNPFLEGVLRANFDRAVSKLMACFEGRAATLYPKAV